MRRSSRIVATCLALFAMSAQAATIKVRATLGANPDGNHSTAYTCVLADRSDCAPPTVATLSYTGASLPSLTGLSTGSSYSENSRAHFSGTGAAACTLSLETVSGNDAATKGWVYSSDNLTNPATNPGSVGSGALHECCTTSGNKVCGTTRNWSISVAGSTDTTAPTKVTGVVASLNASGQAVVGFDFPCDPTVSGQARSGLDTYIVRRDGNALTPTSFGNTGTALTFTSADIGSMSPTGTSTVSNGFDYLESSEGTLPASTDVFHFTYAPLSTDFTATVKLENLTGTSNTFSLGSLMARVPTSGSLSQTDAYASIQQMWGTSGVSGTTRGAYRSLASGTRTAVGNSSASWPSWIQMNLNSGTWTLNQSTDGNTWVPVQTLTSTNLTLSPNVDVGLATSSLSAGNTVSVQYRNLCITSRPRVSYTDSAASAGAHTYTVQATDVAGNAGAQSATSNSVTVPASAAQKKWHPGHYMSTLRSENTQSTRFTKYDSIDASTNVKGSAVFFRWSQLEGATTGQRGDYTAGITLVRSEINKLKSATVPKRLILVFFEQVPSGTCPASAYFPAYLNTAGKLVQTSNKCLWKRWDSEAMGWFIDMVNAYAAAFDDEPYVEIARPFQETTISWGTTTPSADFSEAAYDAQLRRLALAMSTAWKKTNVWIPLNWGVSTTRLQGLISYFSSIGVGTGNPDICPSCGQTVDLIAIGTSGGHDYRGEMPLMMHVEVSELGYNAVGPNGGFTSSQIFTYADGTQRSNYIIWDYNTITGNANQQWNGASGELATINANPVSHTTCPSIYTQGCNTN